VSLTHLQQQDHPSSRRLGGQHQRQHRRTTRADHGAGRVSHKSIMERGPPKTADSCRRHSRRRRDRVRTQCCQRITRREKPLHKRSTTRHVYRMAAKTDLLGPTITVSDHRNHRISVKLDSERETRRCCWDSTPAGASQSLQCHSRNRARNGAGMPQSEEVDE
jgi:hypothetical protein